MSSRDSRDKAVATGSSSESRVFSSELLEKLASDPNSQAITQQLDAFFFHYLDARKFNEVKEA